ncbi:hypothetical protein POV27_20100 [Aureisphaera galaxeae]|uniref:hypothetical protein n=1 Tax=Aureisphaera galaxeae TaxID=1538023 RepID=UPI0023500E39|nr:hypothetical protein [Aureisphaera galaxeae]MDC8006368.1 hypothetical protein [Aureisphaera galaxeae]
MIINLSRRLLTTLCLLVTIVTFGQKNRRVDLKWKIDKNEKLNYSTLMRDIDTSAVEMDFGGLFKSLMDITNDKLEEKREFLEKLGKEFNNSEYVTTLSNKGNGIIDVIMIHKPKVDRKEIQYDTTNSDLGEILKLRQLMDQGAMLRGSVYEEGPIHSFWVKSKQKNVIALFFELPDRRVKVGDKWSIDINLIANDQNFDCHTSHKINEVTLIELKKVNGEKIAVLEYNIEEYVKGDFNAAYVLGGDDKKLETMMKFSYQAMAEFSVDNGRWLNYDGIMSVEGTGALTTHKKTIFTLNKE